MRTPESSSRASSYSLAAHENSDQRRSLVIHESASPTSPSAQEHGTSSTVEGTRDRDLREREIRESSKPYGRYETAAADSYPVSEVWIENIFVYSCDNCGKELTVDQPRIRCHDCEDYDLCANCHLSGRWSGSHSFAHRFEIIQPQPQKTARPETPKQVEAPKESNTPKQSEASTEKKTEEKDPQKEKKMEEKDPQKEKKTKEDSDLPSYDEEKGYSKIEKNEGLASEPSVPTQAPTVETTPLTSRYEKEFSQLMKESEAAWKGSWHPISWNKNDDTTSGIRTADDIRHDAGRARILCSAIFDYINDMYEPFQESKFTSKKFLYSRSFWLPFRDKEVFFEKVGSTKFELVSALERIGVVTFEKRGFPFTKTYMDRSAFIVFHTRMMAMFPRIYWEETCAMINFIPAAYLQFLPKGPPPRSCFPAAGSKDRDFVAKWTGAVEGFSGFHHIISCEGKAKFFGPFGQDYWVAKQRDPKQGENEQGDYRRRKHR
ncbi:hypothetical protein TWF694_008911 [Orbilia ellipsospora]|uniref:ZZ-type domain-containing protein n=1 Tax=Orbilia ellipsospora TaxID=2528407 RepID=A0AAV9XET4_9PEZI